MDKLLKNRNGMDGLSIVGISISFIITLINMKIQSRFLTFLAFIFMLTFGVFRVWSKDLIARRKENQRFLEVVKPIKGLFTKKVSIVECENCHKRMRLPKGKGRIKVTCPHCNHIFYYKS